MPTGRKERVDLSEVPDDPAAQRQALGDGCFGGPYQRPDEDVLRIWEAALAEIRDLLESWS